MPDVTVTLPAGLVTLITESDDPVDDWAVVQQLRRLILDADGPPSTEGRPIPVDLRYCTACGHRQDTGQVRHYPACRHATTADRYRDPEPPVLANTAGIYDVTDDEPGYWTGDDGPPDPGSDGLRF